MRMLQISKMIGLRMFPSKVHGRQNLRATRNRRHEHVALLLTFAPQVVDAALRTHPGEPFISCESPGPHREKCAEINHSGVRWLERIDIAARRLDHHDAKEHAARAKQHVLETL